jgi:hypothetical protein
MKLPLIESVNKSIKDDLNGENLKRKFELFISQNNFKRSRSMV